MERPEAALCAPLLGLGAGPQNTGASMPLFGAIGDSAPDRWGRSLMRRYERRRAGMEKRRARILREADYLLGVDDEIRVGALRFKERPGGPFMGDKGSKRLPRLVSCQSDGCAPIVRAFEAGQRFATPWEQAQTSASGLRSSILRAPRRPPLAGRAVEW